MFAHTRASFRFFRPLCRCAYSCNGVYFGCKHKLVHCIATYFSIVAVFTCWERRSRFHRSLRRSRFHRSLPCDAHPSSARGWATYGAWRSPGCWVSIYELGALVFAHETAASSFGSLNSCAQFVKMRIFSLLCSLSLIAGATMCVGQCGTVTHSTAQPFVSDLCIGECIVVRLMLHISSDGCYIFFRSLYYGPFSVSAFRSSNLFLRCRHVSSAVARVFDSGHDLNSRVKHIWG